ncbi:MAG: leucine-rich repeat domain-containing protein [Spirochaetaceae bacterium]|jgi:hypothetical protein|nr:leucine-rich repeat domain-containing protein [Spirochaetaceae bacterium]
MYSLRFWTVVFGLMCAASLTAQPNVDPAARRRALAEPPVPEEKPVIEFDNSPIEVSPESEFEIDGNGIILRYTGDSKRIGIPESIQGIPVTAIGAGAFAGQHLTGVTLPLGVTEIGKEAFIRNSLWTLDLPEGLVRIGEGAFADNKLIGIAIPDSVIEIGDGAFASNELTSLRIGPGISRIEDSVFYGNELSRIIIPNTVSYIGEESFHYNPITNIAMPGNVNLIDNYERSSFPDDFPAFYNSNGRQAGNYIFSVGRDGSWTYSE